MWGGLITYGGRGGTIIPFIGDISQPANDRNAVNYISSIIGITLDNGRTERMNQALTDSAQYLIDKQVLLKALVEGCDNAGHSLTATAVKVPGSAGAGNVETQLILKLPGAANNFVPPMTSLSVEYRNKFNALVAQGIPEEIAKRQSEDYVKLLLNLIYCI